MESDIRYYRRRANEELAAANRAVTMAARERRMQLAGLFLQRLKSVDSGAAGELELAASNVSAFNWQERAATRA